MTEKIIIAGAGGQGIMLAGKVLAEAAMREKKYVTWLPSYGAEVRGGTAHCMVVISDEPIASPIVKKADTLIIMNDPSLHRFKDRAGPDGLYLVNSSLSKSNAIKSGAVERIRFTSIALELGNIKVANMVALGYFIARKPIVRMQSIEQVIEDIAPADKQGLIAINRQALLAGAKKGMQ